MKHKQKLQMARRMMTQAEIKLHVSPFDSKRWNERKNNLKIRVKNNEVSAKYRSQARKKRGDKRVVTDLKVA